MVWCLLILSPELAVMLKNYDSNSSMIELNFKDLENPKRRYFHKRLIRNLRILETLGIVKIEYLSNRKILVKALNDRFLQTLKEILENVGYNIGFELHCKAFQILNFMRVSPYTHDVRFLAALLGVTTRGVRKIINKLKKLILLDDNLNVTERGLRILSIASENKYLRRFMKFGINPFLCLRLIEDSVNKDIVDAVYRIIMDVINYNRSQDLKIDRVVLLGFESDPRMVKLIRGIAKKMNIEYIAIPVLISEDRLFQIVSTLGYMYDEILLKETTVIEKEKIKFNEIKLLLELLERFASQAASTLFVVFTSPSIAYIIDEYISKVSKEGIRIIFATRIDRELLNLSGRADQISKRAERFIRGFVDAIKHHREILIEWNKDSEKFSYLRINPKERIGEEVLMNSIRIEDGELGGKALFIPLGEIRIDMCKLAKFGLEVTGRINLLGEPIIGLKLPDEKWLRNGYGSYEGTLYVATKKQDDEPQPTIEHVDAKIGWLKRLEDALLCQLHIGLNQMKKMKTYRLISPIITRTNSFIHFWVIDKNQRTYYQLIAKNARVMISSKCIWRTEKI